MRSPMRRRSSRAPAASTGGATSTAPRGSRTRCRGPGSDPTPRWGCISTTRPSTARRTSRRSRSAASRSMSITAISTTSSPICSTTPMPRRSSSTARLAIASRAWRPRSPDGSRHVDGAVPYDELQQAFAPAVRIAPEGDEIYMLYTGGTTGMPKGVMYAMTDFTQFFLKTYPQMVGMAKLGGTGELPALARERRAAGHTMVSMSGPPLMHGTGCWLGMMVPHLLGGTAALLEKRGLDPIELWDTVERERVNLLVIVGDAFARPMLRALDENPGRWDASCLQTLVSSGAMFSLDVKARLLSHLPTLSTACVRGSTEGGMGNSIVRAGATAETARFRPNPTTRVFTEDGREVAP